MKKNYFLRTAIVMAILVLASNKVSAQTAPGGDVAKSTNTVKVVDNKGTIKYFQSNNGITQITNTTADKTTTTWQLGGTLTDDTFIDATGKVFGLKGLDITALDPSSDGASTGYTLLVSDDATGKVERVLATTLIQGGVAEKVLASDESTTYTISATDLDGLPTVKTKISLFRNGIKLRQTDFALATGAITITPTTDLPLYKDDVLEVQWIN
ncbi:MAG: hypothetical protein QMB11_07255 [Nonlabens sp.]|uniref:hypothetical protein n=1 Tax=Nonlabens sp. TaxID=1888209 RepID=UPI0035A649AA